jgi:hypothetical protein
MYDQLVREFEDGDIVFGTDADITDAQHALNAAYNDVFRIRNGFTRDGRALNRKALAKVTPIMLQSGVTNRAMESLGAALGDGVQALRQGGPAGGPFQGKPMPSPYNKPMMKTKVARKEDRRRVKGFRAFTEGHDRFDPKLMGGKLAADGSYQPLGAKVADREWIAQYALAKPALKAAIAGLMDQGAALQLTGGESRAAQPPGQNGAIVEAFWDRIDWAAYPNPTEILNGKTLEMVLSAKIWKRTSKAGLEYQTTVRKRTVHFLLDRFLHRSAMEAVIRKDASQHGRSITSGELRWIYRNWNNPLVRANTRFWTRQGTSLPPWELPGHRDLWELYTPSSADPAPLTGSVDQAYEAIEGSGDYRYL